MSRHVSENQRCSGDLPIRRSAAKLRLPCLRMPLRVRTPQAFSQRHPRGDAKGRDPSRGRFRGAQVFLESRE
jgi:hypothetical protein